MFALPCGKLSVLSKTGIKSNSKYRKNIDLYYFYKKTSQTATWKWILTSKCAKLFIVLASAPHTTRFKLYAHRRYYTSTHAPIISAFTATGEGNGRKKHSVTPRWASNQATEKHSMCPVRDGENLVYDSFSLAFCGRRHLHSYGARSRCGGAVGLCYCYVFTRTVGPFVPLRASTFWDAMAFIYLFF